MSKDKFKVKAGGGDSFEVSVYTQMQGEDGKEVSVLTSTRHETLLKLNGQLAIYQEKIDGIKAILNLATSVVGEHNRIEADKKVKKAKAVADKAAADLKALESK